MHRAEKSVDKFGVGLPASLLQWAFSKIVPDCRWHREHHNGGQNKEHQEEPGWHPQHGSRIEFPSSPVLCVIAPEGRVILVSAFIHLHVSWVSGPGPLEHQDSQDGLDPQENEETPWQV